MGWDSGVRMSSVAAFLLMYLKSNMSQTTKINFLLNTSLPLTFCAGHSYFLLVTDFDLISVILTLLC